MIKELNNLFEEILLFAERNQVCKRKAVGCAAVGVGASELLPIAMKHNGPSRVGHECTNETGNCGCSHSEPRVVQEAIEEWDMDDKLILVCTYSPCTNCANIVIDSRLFGGVIYDILTEHDKRGEKFLREAMPVLSRKELNEMTEEEVSAEIKKWVSCSSD